MALEFKNSVRDLANKTSNAATNADGTPKAKAQYWLNVGYHVDVQNAEGEIEKRFVSLPAGIALDTQEKLGTGSRNDGFSAFQSARNNLLAELIALGETMQPGGTQEIQLTLELRRVNDARVEVDPSENPFMRKGLKLVA